MTPHTLQNGKDTIIALMVEHKYDVLVLLTPRVGNPGKRAAIYLPVDLDPYGYCFVAPSH